MTTKHICKLLTSAISSWAMLARLMVAASWLFILWGLAQILVWHLLR